MNTKQQILNESLKLFSKNGFDAVSIRAIAKEVGVGNSALYKHFPSKRAIFDAIVAQCKEHFTRQSGHYQNSIRNEDDFVEMCLAMFRFQISDEMIVMFRRILLIEQFKNEEMAKIFKEFFIELPLATQEELFRQLMQDGVMKDKDPKVLALELCAPFFLYHTVSCEQEKLTELFKKHAAYFYVDNIVGGVPPK